MQHFPLRAFRRRQFRFDSRRELLCFVCCGERRFFSACEKFVQQIFVVIVAQGSLPARSSSSSTEEKGPSLPWWATNDEKVRAVPCDPSKLWSAVSVEKKKSVLEEKNPRSRKSEIDLLRALLIRQ